MLQVLFYCPDCEFSKEIPQTDIPSTAKECVCPSCRKRLKLSEAIRTPENIDCRIQAIEESAAESQQESTEKEQETLEKYHALMDEALLKLEANNDLEAMMLFEGAEKLFSTPKARSYLAYCRAKINYEFADSLKVCVQALKEEPRTSDHYINLSRIYLLINKRGSAYKAILKGLKVAPHPQLTQEFRKFEKRRLPVFSSLPRDHFLNRNLGKLLARVGLR